MNALDKKIHFELQRMDGRERRKLAELCGDDRDVSVEERFALIWELIDDPQQAVRRMALWSLVRLLDRAQPATATEEMIRWVQAQLPRRRLAIATALGRVSGLLAVSTALEVLCDDELHQVRREAIRSLALRISVEPAEAYLGLLQGALLDEHRAVRLAAIDGLEQWASFANSEEAMAGLLKAATHADGASASRAARAFVQTAWSAPRIALEQLEANADKFDEIHPRARNRLPAALEALDERRVLGQGRVTAMAERLGAEMARTRHPRD